MNNSIYDVDFINTLPDILKNDETMLTLSRVLANELHTLMNELPLVLIYHRIDSLPEAVLDMLAYDFKVDWWSYDYSLEEKRKTLKDSWRVHRHLGTKYAVEQAISAIYENSKVEEWFNYGGEPYHFRLIIPVDEATLDLTKHSTVLNLIAYYKNLRSVLDEVEYHGAASVGTLYAVAAFIGCEITDSATAVQH